MDSCGYESDDEFVIINDNNDKREIVNNEFQHGINNIEKKDEHIGIDIKDTEITNEDRDKMERLKRSTLPKWVFDEYNDKVNEPNYSCITACCIPILALIEYISVRMPIKLSMYN